uniref:Pre-toxin TG domain-containing protein n=1 Tax=Meloidogyne incognita TaxID=6306 RepID=A0A914M8M7_MELIC
MQLKKSKKIFIILFAVLVVHFELFVKAELNGFGGIEVANKNFLHRSKRTLGNAAKIVGSVVGPVLAGSGVLAGMTTKEIKELGEKKNDTKVLDKKPDSTKSDGKPKHKAFLENGDYLWLPRN